jgi:pyruvate/2-oxoglutarate dehydrogenase complex dihydrolipoamide dehydrogenase (E3) component
MPGARYLTATTNPGELLIVTLQRRRIAILGGGPGGYEAALVAVQLGADVTVVDSDGLGGACVLTDCVPSKALIETSNAMTLMPSAASLTAMSADWALARSVILLYRRAASRSRRTRS